MLPRLSLNHFFPARRRAKRSRGSRWTDALLRRLGPSWRAAPLRRVVQTAFFALFLYLFFYVSWPYAETFRSDILAQKERLPAEAFLLVDPLVGISASIAGRTAGAALLGAGLALLLSMLVPRGFCAYVCPLGTLIDLFDGLIGRHVRRGPTAPAGWWAVLKYYMLAATLAAAGFGVLLSGYVAAIPVVTRAMAFVVSPLQLGWMRNWSQVRETGAAEWLSIGLFALVLLLGVVRQRFWCRYLCPSGALFSLAGALRLTERRVKPGCIQCGRCATACPFDAIEPNYGTRGLDCAWCQTCGGVCPVEAIEFAGRLPAAGKGPGGKLAADAPADAAAGARRASRRKLLAAAIGGAAAAWAFRHGKSRAAGGNLLLRPPGSVPEVEFLALCVRCGHCYQACPGPVLHPAGAGAAPESLWTPVAVMTHAGCHQDCNFCTQVCPTGAIRPLTLDEKCSVKMGLAVIRTDLCLPHAGEESCRLCADECDAAGYRAIEIRRIKLPAGDIPEGIFSDEEIEEMTHIDAPFIDSRACVGCGLCEYRCHSALVKQRQQLPRAAVHIVPVDRA